MSVKKTLARLSLLLVVLTSAANGAPTAKYTAKACLVIAVRQPTMLPSANEKVDWDEFLIFRNNQAHLMRERFVIQAALRNKKLRNMPSIEQEDAKHNAIAWLTSQIRVTFPEGKSGIMEVSATEADPNEAATIVNAVIEAYMDEVVNCDRQKRRERYDSLNAVAADKEDEVRRKSEQLKRELESIGAGDGATAGLRMQTAANIFAEYQRQLQRLKFNRNALQGQLEAAQEARRVLADEKPTELEVFRLLNTMPIYRELFNRRMLNDLRKHQVTTAEVGAADDMAAKKLPGTGSKQTEMNDQELKAVDEMLDELHAHCAQMVLEANLREAEHETKRLTARINVASGTNRRTRERSGIQVPRRD